MNCTCFTVKGLWWIVVFNCILYSVLTPVTFGIFVLSRYIDTYEMFAVTRRSSNRSNHP